MTRSELIVALLDFEPTDEDIVLQWHVTKPYDTVEFTIQSVMNDLRNLDGYGPHIVMTIQER